MTETKRLKLRIASDDEMRAIIEAETDEGLKAAYGEMLALSLAEPEKRAWYAMWPIELRSGERVGDLCFKGLSADGVTEIGYGLLPEYWGQGYATEAVIAAVNWASEQPGVTRIEAEAEDDNAASLRVLEKAGFIPMGVRGEEGPRFVWRGRKENRDGV